MAEIDAIDALDGAPVKAQSWEAVISRYQGMPAAAPIVHLAAAIRNCPYAEMLYPVTSMFDIRIYRSLQSRYSQECLVIRFDFTKQEFALEFIEHQHVSPRWKKLCSIEDSFSAFIHFLALKGWFPVQEIPRGTWECRAPSTQAHAVQDGIRRIEDVASGRVIALSGEEYRDAVQKE